MYRFSVTLTTRTILLEHKKTDSNVSIVHLKTIDFRQSTTMIIKTQYNYYAICSWSIM